MRLICFVLCLLLLSACAETDPYRGLDPAPSPGITEVQGADAFADRWPPRFKAVQTVTLDFGPVTRILTGYLIVQRPDRFRIQGMTEQGLKVFDIACVGNKVSKAFAADEFDDRMIENIARDIRRVFLATVEVTGALDTSLGIGTLVNATTSLDAGEAGTQMTVSGSHGELAIEFVGDPALVSEYAFCKDGRNLYRVNQYEWREFGGRFLSSVIVLRERGIESKGPAYKLTIRISELSARDEPWPDAIFEVDGG